MEESHLAAACCAWLVQPPRLPTHPLLCLCLWRPQWSCPPPSPLAAASLDDFSTPACASLRVSLTARDVLSSVLVGEGLASMSCETRVLLKWVSRDACDCIGYKLLELVLGES